MRMLAVAALWVGTVGVRGRTFVAGVTGLAGVAGVAVVAVAAALDTGSKQEFTPSEFYILQSRLTQEGTA